MRYLVNSREMKQYDNNTTEKFFVPSIVLMERAAVAFVDEIRQRKIDLSRVLIVCGSGNNGGDGYAIARLLMQKGCVVDVVGVQGKATEANLLQQNIWRAYGNPIFSSIPEGVIYTAVIDAVFGVGLSREVEGAYASLLTGMNEVSGVKISVDIASGISSDNGSVLGTAFRADLTVTFAFAKLGNLLWPGNEYAGEVAVVDIGIDADSFFGQKPAVAAYTDEDFAMLPARKSHSNKGTYGKLLVIAGSPGMAGAAILCAGAAYACGCGLVRVFTSEENRIPLQTRLPEAVLTTYSAKKWKEELLSDAMEWADVIVCGPGIGMTKIAEAITAYVLKNAKVPVLLDADALNLIAKNPSLLKSVRTGLVVTPHLGEMSRLTGTSVSDIQTRLIESAEAYAGQYHVICVLKDEHTVTAVPGRQTFLNLSGNAGMATAGSGDVLSGVIGSLIAQGMVLGEAAPLGVYLHGRGGDFARKKTGMRGMTASDIIDGIRALMGAFE